jgi:hypothetical protein
MAAPLTADVPIVPAPESQTILPASGPVRTQRTISHARIQASPLPAVPKARVLARASNDAGEALAAPIEDGPTELIVPTPLNQSTLSCCLSDEQALSSRRPDDISETVSRTSAHLNSVPSASEEMSVDEVLLVYHQ